MFEALADMAEAWKGALGGLLLRGLIVAGALGVWFLLTVILLRHYHLPTGR